MAKDNLINLELFVASPGDVASERQAVRAAVAEIEGTIGSVLGINLRPFFWEHDLGPGAHPDGPQGWVDAHSNLRNCDILIGVFWNRLGTPTPDGTTGTEHEFWLSYERWKSTRKPHIMLYFSAKKILQTTENITQASLLLNFKKDIPNEIFSWSYKNPQHFAPLVRQHLVRHVLQVWNEHGRPTHNVRFADSDLKLGLITDSENLIRTNSAIVTEAEEVFFATGSRSRDEGYLLSIEKRLQEAARLVHYRVLMGPPFRALLKEHLLRLLALRPPTDRSFGFKTLHIGLFDDAVRQSEVFIAGNEKRVLVVLPSRRGLGEYNTALVIQDERYVHDVQSFVKQLYAAASPVETAEAVSALPVVVS